MKTVIKTAPTAYPVSLLELKQHLNIEAGWTEDDDALLSLRKVATAKVEQFLRRRLITQTWYAYYDGWPGGNYIVLPFGKLQTITSVKYTDTASDETTWSTDEHNTDTYSDPGRVVLEYGYSWPTASLHPQNPIVIEFVCGYGDAGSDVEDMIRHAIKLTVEDLYGNRGDMIVGMSVIVDLGIFADMLTPYKIHGRPTE